MQPEQSKNDKPDKIELYEEGRDRQAGHIPTRDEKPTQPSKDNEDNSENK